MPSSRSLALQYHIARGTVVYAFERLRAEGYIESAVGSGSYVASNLPDDYFQISIKGVAGPRLPTTLSRQAHQILTTPAFPAPRRQRGNAFRAYQPAVDVFPTGLWSRLSARRMRRASRRVLAESEVRGYRPLREAVASHLGSSRGLKCGEEQVFVVSGTQQALDLIIRLVADPGDSVWMENPGYVGAKLIFSAAQTKMRPLSVDQEGATLPVGRETRKPTKLAYLTPAHQFPTGVRMTLERRMDWLGYSQRCGCWIFEDDYDGEYRFKGKPLPTLQSLDQAGTVIYALSFSKLLFPTLRLGIVVVPSSLVDAAAALRAVTDRYPPYLEQAVLCDFMTEGHFGHHIRTMRELYSERLSVLLSFSRKHLSGLLDVMNPEAGLQTVGWLPPGISDIGVSERAARMGIEVLPASTFALAPPARQGLVLGFASVPPSAIRAGIEALAGVLEKVVKDIS